MSKSKHRRHLNRAKRREIARALRVRLHLHGGVDKHTLEMCKTNDLGLLWRYIRLYGA